MCHYRLFVFESRGEVRLQRNGCDFKMRGDRPTLLLHFETFLSLEKWLGTSTFESVRLCDLHVCHTVSEKKAFPCLNTSFTAISHPVRPVLHIDMGTTHIHYHFYLWLLPFHSFYSKQSINIFRYTGLIRIFLAKSWLKMEEKYTCQVIKALLQRNLMY